MRTENRFLTLVSLFMLSALGVTRAVAFDFIWVNSTSSGQWATRANWQPYPNPPHVPGAGDTATFIDLYFSSEVYVPGGTMLDRMVVDYDAVVDLNIAGLMDLDRISGESLLVDSTATLNLESGWLYTADARLARNATFNITGLDTAWLPDSVLVAGDATDSAGIGLALSATAGVYGTLDVGDTAASGRVVVDGITANLFDPTSLWTINGSADVGTANILGNDNYGQVTLQRGGRMHVTENMAVHGSPTAATQSKITVQTGGNLDVDGALTIGDYGTLELFDSASKISTGSLAQTGTGGSFNWTGGTLEITASHLILDSNTPDSIFGSALTVGAGKHLVVSKPDPNDNLYIGRSGVGSVTISNGGTVEAYRGGIGVFAGGNGTVLVTGPGSAWTLTEGLRVGNQNGGMGSLTIQDRGRVQSPSIIVAVALSHGEVIVDGAGSSLVSDGELRVGNHTGGDGSLTIRNGSSVNSVTGFIGNFDPSYGNVDILGSGSIWNNSGSLLVGGSFGGPGGVGTLNVQSGGNLNVGEVIKVWNTGTINLTGGGTQLAADRIELAPGASFTDSAGTVVRANRLTGFGDASRFYGNLLIGHVGGSGMGQHEVGPGQLLTVDQNLVVGEDAPATLWAYGAGTVSSAQGFIGGEPGSDGSQVRISDSGRTWTVANSLHVGGDGVSAGGTAGLTVANSAVVDAGNIKVWQPGTLELDNAAIVTDEFLLEGTLVGNGQISVDGQLTNAGVVSPGLSPGLVSINGNYVQTASGTLAIDLGGVHEGQFDRLEIHHGSGTLAGGLQVSLYDGYLPPVGSSFQIVAADENLVGEFDPAQISYPSLPGRQWNLRKRGGTITLQVLAALLAGDYNLNGVVDAADYTVWRDTLGSTTDMRANGDDTGASASVIDEADYLAWKSHFGQMAGSGSSGGRLDAVGSPGVPEPVPLRLLLGALCSLMLLAERSKRMLE